MQHHKSELLDISLFKFDQIHTGCHCCIRSLIKGFLMILYRPTMTTNSSREKLLRTLDQSIRTLKVRTIFEKDFFLTCLWRFKSNLIVHQIKMPIGTNNLDEEK